MRITGQWEICKVLQCLETTVWIEIPGQRIASQDLRDFDIEQVRRMKGFRPRRKAGGLPGFRRVY